MIKILTSPGCGGCVRAKSIMDMAGIEYVEFDVSQVGNITVEEMREYMAERGLRSFPQLWNGEEYLGTERDLPAFIKGV